MSSFSHDNIVPRKPVPHTASINDAPRHAPEASSIRMVQEEAPKLEPIYDGVTPLSPGSLATALAAVNIGEDSTSPFPRSDNSSGPAPGPAQSKKRSRHIPRSSLEKPLPDRPGDEPSTQDDREHPTSSHRKDSFRNSKQSIERELGVSGILDLKNSEDTTYHETIAPAVVHETIRQDVHEIVHEVTEREIHEHDIFHRILPIKDVEVLPPRHFVEDTNGRRKEVTGAQVPDRDPEYTHRLLTECFKDTLPKTKMPKGPRQFTARDFQGTEGEYGEYQISGGPLRTDRWWVHPPRLETGGQETGQTYPFHFH